MPLPANVVAAATPLHATSLREIVRAIGGPSGRGLGVGQQCVAGAEALLLIDHLREKCRSQCSYHDDVTADAVSFDISGYCETLSSCHNISGSAWHNRQLLPTSDQKGDSGQF